VFGLDKNKGNVSQMYQDRDRDKLNSYLSR